MSNKYEKALFSHFTENTQRLELMGKVAYHAATVKDMVIEKFWNHLSKKLENHLSKVGGTWKVEFSGESLHHRHRKIMLYKQNWYSEELSFPNVSVAIQHLGFGFKPFIGILVHADSIEQRSVYDAIYKAHNFKKLKKKDLGSWFPIIEDTQIKQITYLTLHELLIVENEQNNYIDQTFTQLTNLAKLTEKLLQDNNLY